MSTLHFTDQQQLEEMVERLIYANDYSVIEIVNSYLKEEDHISDMEDFHCLLVDLPYWVTQCLYQNWHNAPSQQYIVEAYIVVAQLAQELKTV